MMERIVFSAANSSDETLPLLSRQQFADTVIEITPTALEEINECIAMLKKSQYKRHAVRCTPTMIGLVIAAMSVAGIIVSAIPIDKERREWGRQPELMAKYNNYTVRENWRNPTSKLFGICGDAYPLKNLCDYDSIDYKNAGNIANSDDLAYQLQEVAFECYLAARRMCHWPSEYGVKYPWWPIVVIVISCITALAGLALMFGYCCSERQDRISDRSADTRARLQEVTDKYVVDIADHLTINEACAALEIKAEEVSRPARRRAFLSAGLPKYKDVTPLHTFFKGDGKPLLPCGPVGKFAPKEIKEMILDYAGLLPTKKI